MPAPHNFFTEALVTEMHSPQPGVAQSDDSGNKPECHRTVLSPLAGLRR